MNEYTLETLIEANASFHHQHGIHQSDVVKANNMVKAIESSRNDNMPKAGDIVQLTTKHGDYYAKAHIEDKNEDGKMTVCENPYVPFVSVDGGVVTTNTSGGAWCAVPATLERVGKAQKAFVFWGSSGACGGGAVTVYAEVNVWRYVDGNPEFSTENYDQFYVSFHDRPVGVGYLITVTMGASTPHTAFRTDAEYRTWLETYKGVERESAWGNSKIVWTYKQKVVYAVGEVDFATIKGVKGETLNNGTMRKCKRVYDGTTVTTYISE